MDLHLILQLDKLRDELRQGLLELLVAGDAEHLNRAGQILPRELAGPGQQAARRLSILTSARCTRADPPAFPTSSSPGTRRRRR